jgi:uncharacterized protein YegP (UPF0339 family)
MSEAKFQVYQDIAKKYRFRLRAPNNKIVAVGEAYETKERCLQGVHAVKRYASAQIEDLTLTPQIAATTQDVAEEIAQRARILGVAVATLALDNPVPEIPRIQTGELVTFTGRLSSSERGIPQATILICEHDRSFMRDERLASGLTASDGRFRIPWTARKTDWWDDSAEVYAKYEGSEAYLPTKSQIYVFTIY